MDSHIDILKGLTEGSTELKISNLLSIHFTGLKFEYGIIPTLSSLYSGYISNKYTVYAILESYANNNVTIDFKAIYY